MFRVDIAASHFFWKEDNGLPHFKMEIALRISMSKKLEFIQNCRNSRAATGQLSFWQKMRRLIAFLASVFLEQMRTSPRWLAEQRCEKL